jgi:sugar/nucleoside kinase (ribokinase family)
VTWAGRLVARTPVTAVLPVDGERAMATFDPGDEAQAADLAAVAPQAVVLSLRRLDRAPAGARAYATAGDADARAHAGAPPAALRDVHALVVNEREARLLSGAPDAEDAAWRLAELADCVVVTRGPDGALAVSGGELVRAPGVPADAIDTTGAGDLFAAAYVWADLRGAALADRLRWAVLYASLSVRVATAVAGAADLSTLARAGAERCLALPAAHPQVSIKEEQ